MIKVQPTEGRKDEAITVHRRVDYRCAEGSGGRCEDRRAARKHGISYATLYNWKAKYDGLEVSEAKRIRASEDEDAKLKRMLADALLADAMLDNAGLKDLLSKNGNACRQAGSGRASSGPA